MYTLFKSIMCVVALLVSAFAVTSAQGGVKSYWQVGVGLGELPTGGSFKPSFTFGYHLNEHVYFGVVYQLPDEISRGSSSFNAQSAGLGGIEKTFETVSERLLIQCAYTPIEHGPYISFGAVYNGEDSEAMSFDDRTRILADESVSGALNFTQTRPAGWGAALGIGYRYHFESGLSVGFEWTPAWGQYPEPTYNFEGNVQLLESARNKIQQRMDDSFSSNVTNMYKIFHIGFAYRWE